MRELRMVFRTTREKQCIHPIQVRERSGSRAGRFRCCKRIAIRSRVVPGCSQFRIRLERPLQTCGLGLWIGCSKWLSCHERRIITARIVANFSLVLCGYSFPTRSLFAIRILTLMLRRYHRPQSDPDSQSNLFAVYSWSARESRRLLGSNSAV